MSKESFDQPRMAINRVYTRKGDTGETSLAGGQRVSKDSRRLEAYGTVDELNAFVGAARATAGSMEQNDPRLSGLLPILLRVQHELFNLGSILATLPEDVHPRQARITRAEVGQLEVEMDRMNEELARTSGAVKALRSSGPARSGNGPDERRAFTAPLVRAAGRLPFER